MALRSLPALRRRAGRFLQLSVTDKALLARAIFTIARSQLSVRRNGLKLKDGKFGTRDESPMTLPAADERYAQRVSLAIRGAVAAIPWTANCLPQSIAAHHLLRQHGVSSTIYFAATPRLDSVTAARINEPASKFAAHAWVRSGEIFVAGGDIKDAYTPIVWFGQSI